MQLLTEEILAANEGGTINGTYDVLEEDEDDERPESPEAIDERRNFNTFDRLKEN